MASKQGSLQIVEEVLNLGGISAGLSMPDQRSTDIDLHRSLLLASCKALIFGHASTATPDIVDIDWGQLVATATRHAMLPIVADFLLCAPPSMPTIAPALLRLLKDVVQLNRYRNSRRAEFFSLFREILGSHSIPCILRKGAHYDKLLYNGRGLRSFSDIDLFLARPAAPVAADILRQQGFVRGWFDKDRNRIRDIDRREAIGYTMYPDHLPPLSKAENDSLLQSTTVDIAFSIGWYGSLFNDEAEQITLEELALNRDVSGNGRPVFHFIDCCAHLFREAYFEENIRGGSTNGVRLSKFLDVALLFKKLSKNDIMYISDGIGRELYSTVLWSCFHADVLFSTKMLVTLGGDRDTISEFAHSWQDEGGGMQSWRGSMLERLMTTDGNFVTGI